MLRYCRCGYGTCKALSYRMQTWKHGLSNHGTRTLKCNAKQREQCKQTGRKSAAGGEFQINPFTTRQDKSRHWGHSLPPKPWNGTKQGDFGAFKPNDIQDKRVPMTCCLPPVCLRIKRTQKPEVTDHSHQRKNILKNRFKPRRREGNLTGEVQSQFENSRNFFI